MSQQQPATELDLVPEGSPHPCQCSAMSAVDSVRAQRDRIERSLVNTRLPVVQDHPRVLVETMQNAFVPIRRGESVAMVSSDNQQNLESARSGEGNVTSIPRSPNNPGSIGPRRGHNAPCSPRNLDISRNLAFEAARRVHETSSGPVEHQHSSSSSPSPMLDSGPKELEKQLSEQQKQHASFSTKDKVKNVQQILSPYQHNHEQFHGGDPHGHKHGEQSFRPSGNLDGSETLMAFQQQHQRQHTHHHHGNSKVSSVNHHHGTAGISASHHPHSQPLGGHHHVNLPTTNPNLVAHHHVASAVFNETSGHHHGNSGPMSGTSSNSSLINHQHGSSPTVHHHVASNLSASSLISHHHGSSSGSLTAPLSTGNHHHVSSGISSESSSSNANTRAHSRLDHVHELHHHPQNVHAHPSLQHGNPTPETRQRAPSSLEHHPHHHGHIHSHSHSHNQTTAETKSAPVIGVNAIQVSSPAKSKCQCHVVQQDGNNKRGSEEECDENEVQSRTHQPPALPPRPPPRPTRHYETSASNQRHSGDGGCCKKYVVLCCLCGGLSAAVGSLFLAVHAILSAHTASLALFETVPSYIPGTMLILMGLFTLLLARRKLRYGLLMKVCGSVGVVCALVCVLVTVTTTVVHMSRLQGLRECVYTARARSCTCYGTPQSRGDPGVLFEGTPHCEAVHGALYACLRALFGVSVAGILACIFSCMLVYQLLSHEKKKMYWEQLELRCRSLYGQGGSVGPSTGSCGCCNDCGGTSPWWAQTPGNLYTPNPDLAPSRRWRLPWSRSRGPAPSPDSNYGFHAPSRQVEPTGIEPTGPYSLLNSQTAGPYSVLNGQTGPYTPSTASYSVLETPVPLWGPPPPYSDPNSPARRPQVPEPRPRLAKRLDNYEGVNEDHRPRATKRSSGNYENAEEISNSTDPEGGNEGTMKGRRARKPLKGVENGAFQQEAATVPKQSESELYFGDVSSCCGPESSFYDLAVEKEAGGDNTAEGIDYLAARLGKRQLSKRSRLPLPLPADGGDPPSDSYANSDEPRNARGPFLAPDAQYEVIQQGRYAYYTPQAEETNPESPTASGYFRDEQFPHGEEPERVVRVDREREYREEETPQCCLSDATTLDSGWQSGDQPQSDDSVRPVNV